MKQPLVSVVISCYNYGQYLQGAVDSVLSQSYENLEAIIINDGSTDDTETIAKAIKGENITYISQKNSGIVATRNKGIEESKGSFIIFLDADDKLPLDYVESNVDFAEKYKLDIVSNDLIKFGEHMKERRDVLPSYDLELMKHGNIVHISSLIRKSCIGDSRFDENLSRRSHEDWDFFLGLALKGANIKKNPNTALYYRQHGNSRNNQESSDIDKFAYAEVYRDILHKYALIYPSELYYLSSTRFANFIAHIKDDIIPAMEEEASKKLRDQQQKTEDILNSKDYILGRLVFYVPRKIYSLIKHLHRFPQR